MGEFFDAILRPLEYCVAWIMVAFHSLLSAVGLPAGSGWTWGLSIVGLVIVIRILLIPLFVKQIKASRGMQLIQPEMKKIQEKYKGKTDTASRQAMTQETMALYKETGTNPFASCMPILLQSPIFFALFRVLNGIPNHQTIGPLDSKLVQQADSASIFGAPLSDTFMHANTTATRVLTVVLIVLMSATTFTTQRQLMMKNMPASALDNPFAQQQKILLYVLPLIFAVSGVNFPIGVLIYWLVTNIWSMGQQFYVIRRMPAPGSPAEKALQERRARRHGASGAAAVVTGLIGRGPKASPEAADDSLLSEPGSDRTDGAAAGGQRQQPKRQPKSKRSTASRGPAPSGPKRAGGAASGDAAARDGEGERPTKGR
ncbi:MAG TPA: membrane protein insertase YidC [Kineosporiaceae bacterium]